MTSAYEKYLSLLRARCNLIGAMEGEIKFSAANHFLVLRKERHDSQKIWDDTNDAKLKGPVKDLESHDRCLILRAKNTGPG